MDAMITAVKSRCGCPTRPPAGCMLTLTGCTENAEYYGTIAELAKTASILETPKQMDALATPPSNSKSIPVKTSSTHLHCVKEPRWDHSTDVQSRCRHECGHMRKPAGNGPS